VVEDLQHNNCTFDENVKLELNKIASLRMAFVCGPSRATFLRQMFDPSAQLFINIEAVINTDSSKV